MLMRFRFLPLILFVIAVPAMPAEAEIVFFQSGRSLSVRAIRSAGDELILKLRSGGEIKCSKELIASVAPDEVVYPEDVLESLPMTKAILEPPAVPARYRDLVASVSAKHGMDPNVVHAVIQAESAYHSRAVSSKGAKGLMQLMPSTGAMYGALDLYDPKINIEAGVQHLKMLLKRFRSDLPLALAAYNAGEAAVDRFGGIPPFRETQNYVTRIMRILNRRA